MAEGKQNEALDLYIALSRASQWVNAHADRDIRSNGLNRTEFGVLELLYHKGPQPLQQIGEKVLMSWASANRDEAIFPDADRFDVRRKPNRHLTFGAGAHHCLGANLTRLEARICMSEVLRRLPDYRLLEQGIERIPDCSTLNGFLSVPVTFTPT